MAVTFIGKRYARNIKAGLVDLIEVPQRFVQETKDSFAELFGYPIEEHYAM